MESALESTALNASISLRALSCTGLSTVNAYHGLPRLRMKTFEGGYENLTNIITVSVVYSTGNISKNNTR